MMNKNLGCLEFQKNSTPQKYPLKARRTIIGSALSVDIRLLSVNLGPQDVLCVLDVQDSGVAILKNMCKQSILYNGCKMVKEQILNNNDEFVIAGQQFRYVNTASQWPLKVNKVGISVKNKGQQSNSVTMNNSDRKSLILNLDGSLFFEEVSVFEEPAKKTPSPREKFSLNQSIFEEAPTSDKSEESYSSHCLDSMSSVDLVDNSVNQSIKSSPLQENKRASARNTPNDSRIKKLTPKVQKSPLNKFMDVSRVGKLLKTLKLQKSPLNNVSNLSRADKLLRTPIVEKTSNLGTNSGVRRSPRTIPKYVLKNFTRVGGEKDEKRKQVVEEVKTPYVYRTRMRARLSMLRSMKENRSDSP